MVEVKLLSRWSTEESIELRCVSPAATWAWRKSLADRMWEASMSVVDGDGDGVREGVVVDVVKEEEEEEGERDDGMTEARRDVTDAVEDELVVLVGRLS